MSPEQAVSAKHVDMRSDLWSLAVVAYHCVTGRIPFEGETVVSLFLAIDKGVFVAPTKIAPEIPASVDAWFARGLARDVDARFATAKELAETFDEATRGVAPVSVNARRSEAPAVAAPEARVSAAAASIVRPPTLAGATVSRSTWTKRRRLASFLVAVAVAVAGAIGVIALVKLRGSAASAAGSAEAFAVATAMTAAAPDVTGTDALDALGDAAASAVAATVSAEQAAPLSVDQLPPVAGAKGGPAATGSARAGPTPKRSKPAEDTATKKPPPATPAKAGAKEAEYGF
jgi:serine/threonine-protein kinase